MRLKHPILALFEAKMGQIGPKLDRNRRFLDKFKANTHLWPGVRAFHTKLLFGVGNGGFGNSTRVNENNLPLIRLKKSHHSFFMGSKDNTKRNKISLIRLKKKIIHQSFLLGSKVYICLV